MSQGRKIAEAASAGSSDALTDEQLRSLTGWELIYTQAKALGVDISTAEGKAKAGRVVVEGMREPRPAQRLRPTTRHLSPRPPTERAL